MRILIVSDTTGHMRGGVPAATRHLLHGLASRGHELAFCSDVPLGQSDGILFFPAPIFEPKALAHAIRAAIDAFEPEIVHLISMSSPALFQTMPGLGDRPWVLTCHSIPPFERKVPFFHAHETLHYAARWIKFLPNTLAWRYLLIGRRIPHVIAHSEWVRRIVRRYGHPEADISIIPLGHDTKVRTASPTRAGSPADAPALLTVGGIAHTKGQHDAIAAVAKLKTTFPGIRYRIVGEIRDPSYLQWLTRLIDRHGLAPNVEILQSLSEVDKQQLIDSADVYLQPSHEEGFCLAFLEAAFDVPRLVATDAGAMRSICGREPGARVVAPRDPAAIAAAVQSVLADDITPETSSARRRRLKAEFGWQGYSEAHEALYRRLCGQPTTTAGSSTTS